MMEFPIDTGAGDIQRRSSYIHALDVGDGRSDASTRSSARRDENGAVILQFPRGGNQVLKLGADVDELEQERLMALMDERYMTWKHRWFSILEGRPHEFDETLALVFNVTSFTVVIISIIVFAVGSVPQVSGGKSEVDVNDPLFWIETMCIIYFCLEALLRCYCVPFNLLFTPLFIIDLVTITGFFTDFFAGASVSFLRVLRLLRVFRVMKISRYSKTLQLVFKVFGQSASGLSVLLMPIFLVVITSSTILYYIEISDASFDAARSRWMYEGRPVMFQSIFDGIWFSMATITTIGYGDFVPLTLAGKLIASLLALFGVLTLSFPNLVLGANLESAFALHKKSAARESLSKRFRKVWLMVAYIRRSRVLVETRKIKEEQRLALEKALTDRANREKKKARRNNRGGGSGGSSSQGDEEEDDCNFQKFGYHTIPVNKRLFPEMDEEPSDRSIGASGVDRDRALFFELSVSQCASLVQGVHDTIHDDNVRFWNYKGITVRKLLQTLFEAWSGVATLQELYQAFPDKDHVLPLAGMMKKVPSTSPGSPSRKGGSFDNKKKTEQEMRDEEDEELNEKIQDDDDEAGSNQKGSVPATQTMLLPNDVAVACLFLGAAHYLDIFVLRRASIEFVVCLTHRAVMELSLHPECARCECRRSAEFARFIWKQTTGKVTYFTHRSLSKTYATWAAREKYAGMGTNADSSPDLKLHIGVTAAEVQEVRRILNQRTTDLQTVIPDIDRFEGEAMERLSLSPVNGAASVNAGSVIGGRKTAGGTGDGLYGGGATALAGSMNNQVESGHNEVKLTMKLLLIHQHNLMKEKLKMLD